MFMELCCGFCESSIQLDSDWEESCWLMVYRFADAHITCGTFTDRTALPDRAVGTLVEETGDGSSTGV